jgi:iron(III) transport system permease protein
LQSNETESDTPVLVEDGVEPEQDWEGPTPLLKRVFQVQYVTTALVILVVGVLSLTPILYLIGGSLHDGTSVTLRFFRQIFTAPDFGELAYNSILFTIGATAVAVALGTALAYLLVRTNIPFKPLLFASSLVPLVIPGILYTISWIFLASPRIGLFNTMLEPIFGPQLFNIFSLPGMMLVEGLNLAPLVFLLMYAAFRSMDPSLEESALMCGARFSTVLRRVTLPLVKPALLASLLIMAVRAIEAFEVPALLGMPVNIWVFTSRIWAAMNSLPPNYAQAGAYSVTLLLLASIGVFWYYRLTNRGKAFQTVTGKGFRPQTVDLGKWRWPLTGAVLVYFVVAVVMPMLILLYASLQPYYAVPSMDAFSRMTLSNYEWTLTNRAAVRAARNSFTLGIGAATAVMFVMAIASWIVVRTKMRGRWLLDNLAFIPLAVPGLVLGVALLFVYLRFPIPVYGTMWVLFIAYFTRFMPYGMRYASASMSQIGSELEESAATSGASWWQTFRRIDIPLLLPGLVAGWIYIVLVSVRELSSSILLYSPGNEVLAIVIWDQWTEGRFTYLSALGVLLVSALMIIVVVAQKFGARFGIRSL